jgi:iron complex outermembrane recepter protein
MTFRSSSRPSELRLALFLLLFFGLAVTDAAVTDAAQSGTTVKGRLLHSVTLEPVRNAVVVIEELRRETKSNDGGDFTFESVPSGDYHVAVRAEGYSARRTEVTVGTQPMSLELRVDPELHYSEVVSVGPRPRSQFEVYQPTSVLAGQDFDKAVQGSLGETLGTAPGVAVRSLGPAPSRPVIRGMDGDRVLILEDGQRMGDLSSQSADHGVNLNPAAAHRIEVVRGPATLLYGANAIGGLVNVITDQIPSERVTGVRGHLLADLGTGASEGGGAGDVTWGNGKWAVNAGGSGRRSSDVDTPEGEIENSQSRSASASFGLAWTGEKSYLGGSYSYDDLKYGVPVLEEGLIQITPRRHTFSLRSGGKDYDGLFNSYRATLGVRDYQHQELEGEEVGTTFNNDTTEIEAMAGHRPFGRLTGSWGGWFLNRNFEAIGAEALSPPVNQKGFAAFAYEEVTWPHVTLQFGGRYDRADYDPEGGLQPREFDEFSGSVGLLYRPAAAKDAVTLAVSVARATRYPALEELYFFGDHPGNFAFEIGNPTLGSERGLGIDLSLRWRARRASGEVTYFINDISDFIFRQPIGTEEFDELFPGAEPGELPIVLFTAADSMLQGVEAHGDFQLTSGLFAEVGFDYVRGELKDTDEPLPRIPPLRVRAGLRYQYNALQVGGEVLATSDQDRVFEQGGETPTGGATLGKLYASYSFGAAPVSTITARFENFTNELYRNHLSYIKDLVPEMGRNFRLLYSVKF